VNGTKLVYGQDLPDVPRAFLLDARPAGLSPMGLREWARRLSRDCGAPHTARSYRYPYALVAWHRQPVGTDIERVEAYDVALADLICAPEERSAPERAADPDNYLTSLWAAKEALAKALGDALSYEPSRLGSPQHWPGGQAGPWRAERLPAPSRHVAWLCWWSSSRPGTGAGRAVLSGPVR
jgi:hypothetical protein